MAYTLPKNPLQNAIDLQGGPKKTPVSVPQGTGTPNMSVMPEQNMSVMPKIASTPITTQSTGIPNVGIPSIKGLGTTPVAPGVSFSPEIADTINAPVKDTMGLNKRIDPTAQRTIDLRKHFDYLKEKGELKLNKDQTDYIGRVKEKFPDYKNVPDAILYGKIILADPKTFDKYGNIGEKSAFDRAYNLTVGTVRDIGESAMEGIDAYKQYKEQSGQEGAIATGTAITSGVGAFVGNAFTDVLSNIINTLPPSEKAKLEGATTGTEYLGKVFEEDILTPTLDKVEGAIDYFKGEGWTDEQIQNFKTLLENDPVARANANAAVNILNILPGGLAGKSQKALSVKQVLKNMASDAELTMGKKGLFGTATKEVLDAGMQRSLVSDIASTPSKFVEQQVAKLSKEIPDKPPVGAEPVEFFTRTFPKKTVSNDIGLTPTERAKVEQITGGIPAEEYILQKGVGGYDTESKALFFEKQAQDMYDGITNKLKALPEKRTPSTFMDEAIQDMIEQLSASKKLQRAYKADIDALETLLARGEYTTFEKNVIRRGFDKVNSGMYNAKGQVRGDLENKVDVGIREGISKEVQEEGLAAGIDVKDMNKDLRVALTLKDGLLRRLSQEQRNNLFGLQDLGFSAILSGGDPFTGTAVLLAKKYTESKMGKISQALYNLNKQDAKPNVKRGVNISTGDSSVGVGVARNITGVPDRISQVDTGKILVNPTPADSIVQALATGKIDTKKAIESLKKLTPEEIAKSPELVKLQRLDENLTSLKQETRQIGELSTEDLKPILTDIKNGKYTPSEIDYIMDTAPKEAIPDIVSANRELRGLPPKVEEVKTTGAKETSPKIEPPVSGLQSQFRTMSELYGDDLYKLAKKIVKEGIEDYDSLSPLKKMSITKMKKDAALARKMGKFDTAGYRAPTVKSMVKEGNLRNATSPEQVLIQDAANELGMSEVELFDEIKRMVEQGDNALSSEDAFIAKAEAGMEAQMAKDAELQSLQDTASTMPVKEPIPEIMETPKILDDGKIPEQGTFGGIKGVQPKNQVKYNQGDNYEAVRLILSDKDAKISRYGALITKSEKSGGRTVPNNLEMKQIEKELGMNYTEIKARAEEIKKIAREARSAKEEVIVDLTKPKSALPMSSRTPVKYGKVDDLASEARKYKSAEEFINSHLLHGSPNKIEGGELKYGMKKGQDSGGIFLTDSLDVANVFTFGKGTVSYISPSIKNQVVDLTTIEGKNLIKSFIGKKYKTMDGDILEFSKYDFDMMFPSGNTDFASVSMFPEVISKIIKDNKKIGIAFNEYAGGKVGKTYQILEGNIPVKTKQQLLEIYNKSKQNKYLPNK